MAKSSKSSDHKLDMFGRVLPAIDKRMKSFYSELSDEEKKGYTALVAMRAMSSLGDQSPDKEYQLIAVNDLVNLGFWQLSKHPELQHLLLCVAGLGKKQYHPWIAAKSKASKTAVIDEFLMELNPGCNRMELDILRSQHDANSIKRLAIDAGKSDREIKALVDDAKKL